MRKVVNQATFSSEIKDAYRTVAKLQQVVAQWLAGTERWLSGT
jgi:hypothetical protein